MQRKVKFGQGEYYHIYNRGVDKRSIFMSDEDKNHFIRMMYFSLSRQSFVMRDMVDVQLNEYVIDKKLVSIGAYCLMSNHFHILVRAKDEEGVTKFMSKLSTGYAAYFNKKYERTGSLFEGRFKSEHVDNDRYLKYLFAYIHLNPVKMFEPKWKDNGIADRQGAMSFLDHYKYSSYYEYTNKGDREESPLLETEAFPKHFEEKHSFSNFVKDWLTLK